MIKTVNIVNQYMKKISTKEAYLSFLDNDDDLLDQGVPIKSMYNSNDPTGVHLSVKGAEMLADTFYKFFDCDETSE